MSSPLIRRSPEKLAICFRRGECGAPARIDPESPLKSSNRKFRRDSAYIEERLREQGRKPADSDHVRWTRFGMKRSDKRRTTCTPFVRPVENGKEVRNTLPTLKELFDLSGKSRW